MPFLIPSQRLDGVELGGFSGRKIAKYDARQKGTREGDDYRCHREDHAPARNRGGSQTATKADNDARQAADEANHYGLGKKLKQHVEAACANRHANADFAGSFGDRDQHDVHHANAADNERDHGNRRQQIGERVLRGIGRGNG